MKANILPIVLFLAASSASPVLAQFPNFPAADLVLGAPDFVTVGSGANTPSGIDRPSGIAIDPATGKVFVASQFGNRILRFANAAALADGANAEAVLGQINFSGISAGATQSKVNTLFGLFVDGSGRLWVADRNNNRVLMFEGAATLTNGAPADLALGQTNFTNNSAGTTASTMSAPASVFVDGADNLWVAEQTNNRVLKFTSASTLTNGGVAATVVLGQPNPTTGSSGTTDSKMFGPTAIVVDSSGRLWVADQGNDRVLRFDSAATLATGSPASGVLGQTSFDTALSGTSTQLFNNPAGVAVDTAGTLYVLENGNHRITLFKNAAAKNNGAAADGVIGQPDFITGSAGLSDRKLDTPFVGIALDSSGDLWVSDSENDRVLRFSPDRTPPSLTITSRIPRTTAKGRLTVSGTASDASGIASVRFRSGRGAFKTAVGTSSWSAKVSLKPGKNSLEFLATDSLGNLSSSRLAKVTRN